MSKEKQIEEIAETICCVAFEPNCKPCRYNGYCREQRVAKHLYEAGYRKQEWISVEERLPEVDGDFLVWNDFHGIIVGHYFERGKYFISKACTVTHWMPLPEPPKGE